jgi:hypothetical protein
MTKRNTTGYFWTDLRQAEERLIGTVVSYAGEPCKILEVTDHADGCPRGLLLMLGKKETLTYRKRLDSPKFNRFRTLPELGWINIEGVSERCRAYFASRIPSSSRSHGLTSTNVRVTGVNDDSMSYNTPPNTFDTLQDTQGFYNTCLNLYPSLSKILLSIKSKSCIAFSRRFAVVRTDNGIRFLLRDTSTVGYFSSVNSLTLFDDNEYLREELMAEPFFTVDNIQGF